MRQKETQYRQKGQKDKIMKIEHVPISLLLMFTTIYMMFGKDTPFWNGAFFVTNYAIMTLLFRQQKNKHIRNFGSSLSMTILLFAVLKFFISLSEVYLNILNVIIFIIIAVAFYKLEPK